MKKIIFITLILNVAFTQGEGGENMEVLGYLEFGQGASDITGFYQDGREFAVVGLQNSTVFVDITDPENPWEIDRISGGNSIWRDLKYHNRHVYIGTEASDGVKVVSVDNPDNPILVNTITDFTNSHNIHTRDGYLYVVGANGCDIWIYNLDNPANPVQEGCWNGEYIHDLDVYNDKAYAMGIYTSTAYIIDLSDKSNPYTITNWNYSGMAHDAAVTEDEQILLTADETFGGHIKLWDISNLGNINLVGEYQTNPSHSVHNVYTIGNFAVMSYYADGTRVLDISDPSNPEEIGYYDTSFQEGLYVGNWGTYIYLPSGVIISSDVESGSLFVLSSPIDYTPPVLDYSPGEFEFILNEGETQSDAVTITNTGDEESTLNYSVNSVPFANFQGGPDEFGHFWGRSDSDEFVDYEWIDIDGMGNIVSFPTNDIAGDPVELDFSFPFYGSEYSQCVINPNGWVGFGSDNNGWDNLPIPSPDAPSTAIFGLWDDLNPVNDNCNEYCSGNVYYHSTEERFVVWFDQVAHWWTNYEDSYYDFQFVLYPSGKIKLNYRSIQGEYSATIGIQNNNGSDALEATYNGTFLSNEFSIKIDTNADWLEIDNDISGELLFGESAEIPFTINSINIDSGEYGAYLKLSSNGGSAFLPVGLTVSGNTITPGDVNFDGEVNIVDIVITVNFIIDLDIPTSDEFAAADMNDDGSLDVVDIVLLVNLILDS